MSDSAAPRPESWLFPRVWGFFLLVLVGVTYPLWFTLPGQSGMPSIPLVGIPFELAWIVRVAPSMVLVACLLAVVAFPRRLGKLWWLVAACLALSFLIDQHRLQPWAYQSMAYALVFAWMEPARARRYLIPLAASIYLYSAAGKFDYQFTHTVGQDFLGVLASPFGGLPEGLDVATRARIALLLPAVELFAGLGILFRRTRPLAALAVMLMHGSLIGILGPWGLGHSTGVLIWNVLLIIQACFLFLRPEPTGGARQSLDAEASNETPRRRGAALRWVQIVYFIVLFAPLLERSGYWDHWTSWSLYSPHTSRVEIEVHRSLVPKLGPKISQFIDSDTDGDGWQELSLSRWSLETRHVPVYPQARYQLAVAVQLAETHQIGDGIRARLRSVSNRWTGSRQEHLMLGLDELRKRQADFWLSSGWR